MNETNDQKLTHIIADIDRLLGKSVAKPRNEIEYLGDLGLTTDEANVWLDQEPSYPTKIYSPLKPTKTLQHLPRGTVKLAVDGGGLLFCKKSVDGGRKCQMNKERGKKGEVFLCFYLQLPDFSRLLHSLSNSYSGGLPKPV